jgi:hypothetical protein
MFPQRIPCAKGDGVALSVKPVVGEYLEVITFLGIACLSLAAETNNF